MSLTIADRVFLQSFSCDASKSKRFTDCEKDDKTRRSKHEVETQKDDSCSQEIVRSRCRIESKICGATQRKDTCVSSQNDKRQESESCKKNYTCPELKRQKPCSWDIERCPETRECDEKARVSSRDRARQSRDSNCSQKQGNDRRCNKNNTAR